MEKIEYPVTPAVRVLRESNIPFEPMLYRYEEHGGTALSASALGVSEHAVVKTLVMETEERTPIIILMHGDCEVSTKNLARFLAVKNVAPCDERTAQKFTGYLFGGTSPLGTRVKLLTYAEKTIFDLPKIYINGGKRGFLIAITPSDLLRAIEIVQVEIAVPWRGT